MAIKVTTDSEKRNNSNIFGSTNQPFFFLISIFQHITFYLIDATSALLSAHLFLYSGAASVALIYHLLQQCSFTSFRLRQLLLIKNQHRQHQSHWHHLEVILKDDLATFQSTFIVDAVVGRLLTGFLVVTTPQSAFMLMILGLGMVKDRLAVLILLAPPFFQLFTLAAHCYMGLLSKKLHSTARLLLSLSATKSLIKVGNLRAKMHLEANIGRLNVRKRKYGITYGKIQSLVSFQTFGKVSKVF